MTEYLRLAGATAAVLAPGVLLARAFGRRSPSAALSFGLGAIGVAWAAVFAVHADVSVALWILAGIGAAALAAAARRRASPRRPGGGFAVAAAGAGLGVALWPVAGAVVGDALFHLARVRKLLELGDLHLRTVDEFRDGGLHPGYAFPLWHGFEAMVAKVSGLDPSVVVRHEASILAPLACVVVWEAGAVVFRSAWAGVAVLAGELGIYVLAQGHGGAWTSLALPATAARQILVPAGIALFFGFLETRSRAALLALAALFAELTLVHVTYGVFLLIPLAAYALVRPREWPRSAAALAASVLPSLAVVLWLRPIADQTLGRNPSAQALLANLHKYAGQLDVWSADRFRVAPELFSRTGAVAVAALVLVPLAGLAARRRWSAFVLAGTLGLLALLLVPELFVRFTDLFSLSQARRAAGFLPLPFALAGGLALLARSVWLAPLALVAGIALEERWPGNFAYGAAGGGPRLVTWIAFGGAVAGLVLGLAFFRRAEVRERHALAALAACLFVAPVAWHAASRWSALHPSDPHALSPVLLAELRRVPPRSVIIATPRISYRLLAAAPVYVVCSEPTHVANTTANRPYARAKACTRWVAGRAPGVARRYGATWAVRKGRLYRLPGTR